MKVTVKQQNHLLSFKDIPAGAVFTDDHKEWFIKVSNGSGAVSLQSGTYYTGDVFTDIKEGLVYLSDNVELLIYD